MSLVEHADSLLRVLPAADDEREPAPVTSPFAHVAASVLGVADAGNASLVPLALASSSSVTIDMCFRPKSAFCKAGGKKWIIPFRCNLA